ncbi:MAG TPA: aspartyl protease family protein [Aliidongia sp.]|nr:aspartyl protease family protein [Aliidongia sp.]
MASSLMRWASVALLPLGLFLGEVAAARAEPPAEAPAMAPQQLIDLAREAAGGAAWDQVTILHRFLTLSSGGLTGTLEAWAEPGRARTASRYKLGPDSGAEGWDGRTGWSADWAHRVHFAEGDDLALLRANAIWSSFGFLLPNRLNLSAEGRGSRSEGGKSFDLVRLAAPGVTPIEVWFERTSHLPLKLVVESAEPITVRLVDWRRAGALTLPYTIQTSTGLVRYDATSRLDHASVEPAAGPNPFAPPPAPPPDYVFAEGRPAVMPLEPIGTAVLVDVVIDGHGPYRFALDSGSSDVIDSGLARELGLPVAGAFHGRGAGEQPVDVGLTRVAALGVGDLTLRDQLLRVVPLDFDLNGEKLAYRGLIGFELFDRLIVRLDHELKQLTLSEPAGWSYRGDGKMVPFRFHGRVPVTDGVIDMVPGRFTLDTGQGNSLTLYRPFLEAVGIVNKYPPKFTTIVAAGVGGTVTAGVARAHLLKLGSVDVSAPVVYLSHQRAGAFADPAVAGNVGEGVFERFNVTFDYHRKQAYFERTPHYDDGDSIRLMAVKAEAFGLRVLSVLPGGSAADAGIRTGDLIERIGNKEAQYLDYWALRRLFSRPAGTKLQVHVRRGGATFDATITLAQAV